MSNYLKRFFAFSVATLLLLAGCSSQNSTSTTEENMPQELERLVNKEEFIVATHIHDEVFDPCMGWGRHADPVFQSKLYKVSGTELVGDLATEYKISDDSLVWTFKIRDDVLFHDGVKLTAKDVAFTFNNTKAIGGPADLTAMDEAVAVDDTTVEFRMNKPYSAFLHTTATLGIVPEHAYGDSASYHKNPIGSGPMKFVQYEDGEQLIMERNDDYYGKKANFKRIVVVNMDEDAAFAAAKAGQVDLALVNAAFAQQSIDNFKLITLDTYDYRVISMPGQKDTGQLTDKGHPMGNNVTSDVAIRKALSLGISRDMIVDNAMSGFGEKTFDVVSKFPWGIGEEVKNVKDSDIEGAKKILEEAGWVLNSEGVREKDGIKAEFTLMYGPAALDRQAIAISFAEQAKALGIVVNAVELDWSEIEIKNKQNPLVLGGGQYSPMILSRLYDSSYANVTGYNNTSLLMNSKTDEYIEKAITATSNEEANEYWKKVQWDGEQGASVLGDTVYIPICYLKRPYFLREGLSIGTNTILPHDHGSAILMDIVNWDYVG